MADAVAATHHSMTGRPSSKPLRRDAICRLRSGGAPKSCTGAAPIATADLVYRPGRSDKTATLEHQRTGCLFGLESAVRRLRNAQVEPGTTDLTDIDQVPYHPTWNASHRRFVDASAAARWDQVPEATGQKSVLCASRQLFTHFGPQDLTAGPDGSCRS